MTHPSAPAAQPQETSYRVEHWNGKTWVLDSATANAAWIHNYFEACGELHGRQHVRLIECLTTTRVIRGEGAEDYDRSEVSRG